LAADVNAIAIGYRGRIDMLRRCFGGEEEQEPAPFTPDAFRSVFRK
jgi:hypothetical protein